MTPEDLRASVAAGILNEEQAARLIQFTQERQGLRENLGDDEPFELLKGFSEVFISVGLVILAVGIAGTITLAGAGLMGGLLAALIAAGLARYFTIKRRMILPSIVLTVSFAASIFVAGMALGSVTTASLLTMAALCGWYAVFRIPFTMFLIGLYGFWLIRAVATALDPAATFWDYSNIFDFRAAPTVALGTLILGVIAFVAGMWFDLQDRHRLGRKSASAFWLHLLAAPALVNTVAMTFLKMETTLGNVLLLVSLLLITALALIIDRRSFLTAGLVYFGTLLWMVFEQLGATTGDNVLLFVIVGALVTIVGAKWIEARSALMRMLPDFPFKDRLPPY